MRKFIDRQRQASDKFFVMENIFSRQELKFFKQAMNTVQGEFYTTYKTNYQTNEYHQANKVIEVSFSYK